MKFITGYCRRLPFESGCVGPVPPISKIAGQPQAVGRRPSGLRGPMFERRTGGTNPFVRAPPTARVEMLTMTTSATLTATGSQRTRSAKAGSVPPRTADLAELDDAELLTMIQARPPGDSVRDAACEVLVVRYRPLVRTALQEQQRVARGTHAGRLRGPAEGDQQFRPQRWRKSGWLRTTMRERRDQTSLPR